MNHTPGMTKAAEAIASFNGISRGDVIYYIEREIGPEIEARDKRIAEMESTCSSWEEAHAMAEALTMSHEGHIEKLQQQLASVTAERDVMLIWIKNNFSEMYHHLMQQGIKL